MHCLASAIQLQASVSKKQIKNPKNKRLIMARVKERVVDIEQVINRLDPKQKETTQNLRALIKTAVPEAVEVVRENKISYRLDGKDFVWISNYPGHGQVELEFFMGASLDSDLLRSRGVEKSENVRHVKVGNFDKLKPELTRLLKAAAVLDMSHCGAKA
jgi:hypothetical protein